MTISKTKRSQKEFPVDYTKKGFSEIKEDLKGYIERNYPDTYKDFNKTSFGSMMLDLVSYVADQLHYYIDHNANEANPVFAKEADNIIEGLHALGAKPSLSNTSSGFASLYIPVPADPMGIAVDKRYNMVSHAGTVFRSQGGNTFTQDQDVVVNTATSQIIGHKAKPDGSLEWFLLKATVPVTSGEIREYTVEIGDPRNFLEIEIPDSEITKILKVTDSNDNQYHQVDNLSTDVIMVPVVDNNNESNTLKTRMKRKPVPRRFTEKRTLNKTSIIFGNGSDSDLNITTMLDPAKALLKTQGRGEEIISNPKQGYNNVLPSGGLGVAPANTTITIQYKANSSTNSNAAVGTINQVIDPIISFSNEQLLDAVNVDYIRENVQIYNEEPLNGFVSIRNTEELKHRYLGNYSTQGRAVTLDDYVNSVYSMPASFGAIKRAAMVRDTNDLTRNLNLYVIAEGADGKLEKPSMLLKQNAKTWLNTMKMVSDSVDIFDAQILNIGLDLKFQIHRNSNPQTVISTVRRRVFEELMSIPPDIGESFSISEVERIMNEIPEIVHIPKVGGVVVRNYVGRGKYSDYSYDIPNNMSQNESSIFIPENTIWEIKFIDDIRGTVITR